MIVWTTAPDPFIPSEGLHHFCLQRPNWTAQSSRWREIDTEDCPEPVRDYLDGSAGADGDPWGVIYYGEEFETYRHQPRGPQ